MHMDLQIKWDEHGPHTILYDKRVDMAAQGKIGSVRRCPHINSVLSDTCKYGTLPGFLHRAHRNIMRRAVFAGHAVTHNLDMFREGYNLRKLQRKTASFITHHYLPRRKAPLMLRWINGQIDRGAAEQKQRRRRLDRIRAQAAARLITRTVRRAAVQGAATKTATTIKTARQSALARATLRSIIAAVAANARYTATLARSSRERADRHAIARASTNTLAALPPLRPPPPPPLPPPPPPPPPQLQRHGTTTRQPNRLLSWAEKARIEALLFGERRRAALAQPVRRLRWVEKARIEVLLFWARRRAAFAATLR